jgi:hypothetical protein
MRYALYKPGGVHDLSFIQLGYAQVRIWFLSRLVFNFLNVLPMTCFPYVIGTLLRDNSGAFHAQN